MATTPLSRPQRRPPDRARSGRDPASPGALLDGKPHVVGGDYHADYVSQRIDGREVWRGPAPHIAGDMYLMIARDFSAAHTGADPAWRPNDAMQVLSVVVSEC